MINQKSSVVLPLARWYAWAPSFQTQAEWFDFLAGNVPLSENHDDQLVPDVKFIDALTRRRLSPYARMGLAALNQLVATEQYPMVFASRHGDVNKTVNLLMSLAHKETLSPTAFGLSVHNAVAGLWAIIQKNKCANIALAAGAESLSQAMIEVYARMQAAPSQPYVLLYLDEAVPDIYRCYLPEMQFPHVCAFLFDSVADHCHLNVSWENHSQANFSDKPQSFSVLSALLKIEENTVWHGSERCWYFSQS